MGRWLCARLLRERIWENGLRKPTTSALWVYLFVVFTGLSIALGWYVFSVSESDVPAIYVAIWRLDDKQPKAVNSRPVTVEYHMPGSNVGLKAMGLTESRHVTVSGLPAGHVLFLVGDLTGKDACGPSDPSMSVEPLRDSPSHDPTMWWRRFSAYRHTMWEVTVQSSEDIAGTMRV
jgi:hypothetical protein